MRMHLFVVQKNKELNMKNSKNKDNLAFVVHYCKNQKCNNCWTDEDLTNAKTFPPKWKYCKDCCEKYGFINPEKPPKKKLSQKQQEVLKRNQFSTRKKATILKDNPEVD